MTEARYDAVADFYGASWSDDAPDAALDALLDLTGPVAGRRVLDLACGHGRVSRRLAGLGATVVGVDLSAALIAKAQAAEDANPLGIDYRHGNAADPLDIGQFDRVVCSFALSDIDDLDGALANVRRCLRPGGQFTFSILHPCFPGAGPAVSGSWPAEGTYYDERWWAADGALSTLRQRVGANHRTLATYLNALRRNDLWLDEVAEPPPLASWVAQRPEAGRYPVYFLARCVLRLP
jgi:2-polyprenyl-3-methyl-5-hydroxy-6-metoxy-1,4-benzoquinol methylase